MMRKMQKMLNVRKCEIQLMHMYRQYLNKHNLIVLMLEDQNAPFHIKLKYYV